MAMLPIVERELLVAARRPWTWWFRVAVAGLALVAAGLMVGVASSWWGPQQVGEQIFYAVGIATMTFAIGAGPFVTADAISSERREGTLGLLLLTNLRSHDVVLGKLAAASLNTAAALLATLPLLALPMLTGGVAWSRVVLTALLLVVTLAMSLAVGLMCSAWARNGRLALLATLTILVGIGGLPFIEMALEGSYTGWMQPAVSQWVLLLSPPYLASGALEGDLPFQGTPLMLGIGIAFQALLAATALRLACWRLPRLLTEPEPPAAARKLGRWHSRWDGRGGHAFWRATGDQTARKFVFRIALFFTVVAMVLLAGSGLSRRWDREILFAFSLPVAYFIHLLIKCQFAAEAADRFHYDRSSGGLEVLLSTPLPVRVLLREYWRGLRMQFAASRVLAVGVNATVCILLLTRSVRPAAPDPDAWWILALVVTGMAFVWLDGRALTWAALRAALRARTAGRAMLAATARVLMPGWVAILLWLLWQINGNPSQSALHGSLVSWMAGFLAWDLWRAWQDRRWLERNLRAVLAGEWNPPSRWWRRWASGRKPAPSSSLQPRP